MEKLRVTLTSDQWDRVNEELENSGVDPRDVLMADLAGIGIQSGESKIKNLPSQAGSQDNNGRRPRR